MVDPLHYVAKDLAQIAARFEQDAAAVHENASRARTQREAAELRGMAYAWERAAEFLRHTTLDPSLSELDEIEVKRE